jgi:periplasmic mercuric ion binding protein
MSRVLMFALFLGVLIMGVAPMTPAAQAAEPQTVLLDVENMTCRMCPVTVRRALNRIDGVLRTEARYEGGGEGWAKVTFDPSRVEVEDLIRATGNAGFPSTLKE